MQVTRSSVDTFAGPPEWFTGAVYIDTVATPSEATRVQASSVLSTSNSSTKSSIARR